MKGAYVLECNKFLVSVGVLTENHKKNYDKVLLKKY